ncbi:MAG TPA: AMP-binding protein [Baekduia sp.]|nr:AMP-binding protein [Baekduia sp.]
MYPGAQDPARPALVMADSGQVVTFGELDATANRFAHLLRSWGVQPGDHLAYCIENHPVFFDVTWGAHYAGVLYTAMSTRLGADEAAYIVNDCGAKVLVLSARYADKAAAIKQATPGVAHHLSVGGAIEGYEPLEDLLAGQPSTPVDEARIGGKDMLYSSGTTGKPKGIVPADLTTPLEEAPIIVTPVLKGLFGVTSDDVYLSPAPLYHAAPLRFCLAFQQLGCQVVVMERFDPQRLLDLIAEHRVTHTQLVPTMFVRLLRLEARARAAADVSTLKMVLHAGAPCPVDVKQQMFDWWGPIIHEYYASTEGCGLTWVRPEEWLAKPGSVGKALIGTPHIVAADGREAGPGETGAVFFSDGPRFRYHNDPGKTAENTNAQGWQTFGDIGHLDEDGFLYLTDRASYMIITGGVNVYPQEAEDALQSHPKVMDAAVFGVPHPEWGEEVKGVVQPVELPADDAAAEALEAELLAYLHERLAKLKCPRSIDFRAELPRHDTGKLYKRLLKDEYAATAKAAAAA